MTQTLIFHNNKFEHIVRESLQIFDQVITTEDILSVVDLDLSNFCFKEEDFETLLFFTNLRTLSIKIDSGVCFRGFRDLSWTYCGYDVDFGIFANMKKLTSLCVSGGCDYDIPFKNLDALISLAKLEHLQLRDFGPIDLSPLCKMPQLKTLALCRSRRLQNISTIFEMIWLKELVLEHLYIENLDFLDFMPDTLYLKMRDIDLIASANVSVNKWKRFEKRSICNIVKGWESIDLSPLDE